METVKKLRSMTNSRPCVSIVKIENNYFLRCWTAYSDFFVPENWTQLPLWAKKLFLIHCDEKEASSKEVITLPFGKGTQSISFRASELDEGIKAFYKSSEGDSIYFICEDTTFRYRNNKSSVFEGEIPSGYTEITSQPTGGIALQLFGAKTSKQPVVESLAYSIVSALNRSYGISQTYGITSIKNIGKDTIVGVLLPLESELIKQLI